MVCDEVNWIQMAQDKVNWWVLPTNFWILWTPQRLPVPQKWPCSIILIISFFQTFFIFDLSFCLTGFTFDV
jgi:hypothetical protein